MAAITSAQTALPNKSETWANGIGPVEGDKLTIAAGPVSPLARTHIWANEPLPLTAADKKD
jgi:hypothetical protein